MAPLRIPIGLISTESSFAHGVLNHSYLRTALCQVKLSKDLGLAQPIKEQVNLRQLLENMGILLQY